MVMMAYRSTSQETTNISPNRMMMGREISLPIDLLFGNPPNESYSMFETDYIQVLQGRLQNGVLNDRRNSMTLVQLLMATEGASLSGCMLL